MFHCYTISFGIFYSLLFAVSLSFSYCWGKTFQFPLPPNFKSIFFRSMNFCSVIREKKPEMLCFHGNVKKFFFFFHCDSPEISQANLIV